MLVPKQKKNVAHVLHNNSVKFPKDFSAIVISTNMAAVTSSSAIKVQKQVYRPLRKIP